MSLSRIIHHSHSFTRLEIYHHIYFIVLCGFKNLLKEDLPCNTIAPELKMNKVAGIDGAGGGQLERERPLTVLAFFMFGILVYVRFYAGSYWCSGHFSRNFDTNFHGSRRQHWALFRCLFNWTLFFENDSGILFVSVHLD